MDDQKDLFWGESRGYPSVSALSFFVGRASRSDITGKQGTDMWAMHLWKLFRRPSPCELSHKAGRKWKGSTTSPGVFQFVFPI